MHLVVGVAKPYQEIKIGGWCNVVERKGCFMETHISRNEEFPFLYVIQFIAFVPSMDIQQTQQVWLLAQA